MSLHIAAQPGEIADVVLLPGDPLRAKHIAETYLQDVHCYTQVRGMFGFTGSYRGRRISVQGTGMGIPSSGIYIHELLADYGARTLMRVGTCGGVQPDLQLGDVLLASAASHDSAINLPRFGSATFAPCADFTLLKAAHDAALAKGIPVRVGPIFSTDSFYHEDPDYWRKWAAYGVLAIEMEAAGLYTLASKFGARALALLTVSDVIPTEARATTEQRQTAFMHMVEIALEVGARS